MQNFPVISGTSFEKDKTTVQGGLNSTPSTKFTLQFFTTGLRPSDNALLGTKTVTTNAAGIAYFSYDFQALPSDLAIAATATDPAGNTSEFSPAGTFPRLANISARGDVGQGDNLLVGGFILRTNGNGKERVLVRALGPSLAGNEMPLPGRLADPTLELRNGNGVLVGANDNWRSEQEVPIIATGNAPKSDKESALIANLSPGGYTVQVRGANGGTGIAVVEIYTLGPFDEQTFPRLKNISARATVGAGNKVLIGGLIVAGDAAEKVLVRAIGPDLAAFDVKNALQNPTLELRDAFGTLLGANDDWRSDQEDEINATNLAPNDDRDAAVISTLLPGAYTAIVRGVDESSGTGVVEIYDLSLAQ